MGLREETRATKPTFAGWLCKVLTSSTLFFLFLDELRKRHVALVYEVWRGGCFSHLSGSGGVASFCKAEDCWTLMGFVLLGLYDRKYIR